MVVSMVLVCQTFRGLATISALEPVSGVQHRPVKLVVHVQPLTSCCYKWVRSKHFPGISNLDLSSMAHLRELMETDIDAAWKLWHLLVWGLGFRKGACALTLAQASAGQSTQDRRGRLWS